jgi:hypothetical protein
MLRLKSGFRAGALLAFLLMPLQALAAPIAATLYKSAQCACCEGHARHLEANGFAVEVKPVHDLFGMARKAGVPEELDGCHVLFVDGYVVVGHVPADVIKKLLDERPKIIGVSLPGMPLGVPGMEGPRNEPLTVYAVEAGAKEHKAFVVLP